MKFSELKCRNFDNARRGEIFHYAVWGIDHVFEASGESNFTHDFTITFDDFLTSYQTSRSQVEEFVHELGHDLRQRHAGDDDYPLYKPNYWSVMAYTWDLRTGWPDNHDRAAVATCLPFYYAKPGADEPMGAVPTTLVTDIIDYSEGMAKPVLRPLTGSTSVCGKTVDWSFIDPSDGTLKDFANWRNLNFGGPVANGWPTAGDGIQP